MKPSLLASCVLSSLLTACSSSSSSSLLSSEPEVNPCFSFSDRSLPDDQQARSAYLVNSELYVWTSALDDENGVSSTQLVLWKIDLNAPSPDFQLLDQIEYQPNGFEPGGPSFLLADGDTVYFTVNNAQAGRELWSHSLSEQTDTGMLFDFNPGAGSSEIEWMVKEGDQFFLAANDGVLGRELYQWSGDTEVLPSLVADLNTAPQGGSPQGLTAFENQLVFSAETMESGRELWQYPLDQSSDPSLVADIFMGTDSGLLDTPTEIVEHDNKLYFFARDSSEPNRLWSLDQTGVLAEVQTFTAGVESEPSDFSREFLSQPEGLYFLTRNADSFSVTDLMLLGPDDQLENLGRVDIDDGFIKFGQKLYYPTASEGTAGLLPIPTSYGVDVFDLDDRSSELVVSNPGRLGYSGFPLFLLDEQLIIVENQRVRLVSDTECL